MIHVEQRPRPNMSSDLRKGAMSMTHAEQPSRQRLSSDREEERSGVRRSHIDARKQNSPRDV